MYQFDEPGSGRMVYTVRMSVAKPLEASCTCFDHVRDGFVCKHIIAALVTASRLDARTVPLPALPPEGSAPEPAGGTGVATEALRALRDAEEDAARLREEVKSRGDEVGALRDRLKKAEESALVATAPSVPAVEVRRLTSDATREEWHRAIDSATDAVRLACFTFDLQSVIDRLKRARRRSVAVKLMFSGGADRNLTRNQTMRLQELRQLGCDVRAWTKTRMHAKWLIADAVLVVGSCNFTEASQTNLERGVRLRGLPAEEIAEEIADVEGYFDQCTKFAEGIGVPIPPSPMR